MKEINNDCRIILFNKWILPKTKSMFSFNEIGDLTCGYFDSIKVLKIETNCKEEPPRPLNDYFVYKRKLENDIVNEIMLDSQKQEYTSQQLFMFTSAGDECLNECVYDEEKIKNFWDNSSLLRYYSILHIENGSDENTLYSIVKNVNKQFSQIDGCECYSVLCYFSLDYSDIIVCARDIPVSEFAKKIYNINYACEKKLVRDSFSLISANFDIYKIINSTIKSNVYKNYCDINCIIRKELKKEFASEYNLLFDYPINITFNIGVQNYETFKSFLHELSSIGIGEELIEYKMIGRHDVSLSNVNANFVWLIVIQCILDRFSTESNAENSTLNIKTVLFNFEAYLRIPFDEEEKDSYSDERVAEVSIYRNNEIYKQAQTIMDQEIKIFKKASHEDKYIIAICTLKNSILGLLKNGFAEDFVLCIFESFVAFLQYINNQVNTSNDKEFELCFDHYFNNINALTNSAMHSDRQFIQSPSFNPVFYDVPPKLMAYYMANIRIINEIIRTEEDNNNYSFVFRPSFLHDSIVSCYSFTESPPADRLLDVTIREEDFYYPSKVISQMCHEVAHYVGDGNRQREVRKERFLKCILYLIVYDFVRRKFTTIPIEKNISDWINEVVNSFNKTKCFAETGNFSNDYAELVYKALIFINEKSKNSNRKFLYNNSNEMEYRLLNRDFQISILKTANNTLYKENNKIKDSIEIISNIFSEAYADVQMILILDVKLEDYVETFNEYFLRIFNPQNASFEDFVHKYKKIYERVFSIVALFTFIGYWEISNNNSKKLLNVIYNDMSRFFNYFHEKKRIDDFQCLYGNDRIRDVFEKLKDYNNSSWNTHQYEITNIQKYLVEVYNSSKKHYGTCKELIEDLRSNVTTVDLFKNAVNVFSQIQRTNEKYADKLFLLNK